MSNSVPDPEPVVKRAAAARPRTATLVAMVPDEKIMEVAGFVRASYLRRGVPCEGNDVYQDAALASLITRERYGDRMQGNPFNYLSAVAFRWAKLNSLRMLSVVSVSEKKIGLATEMQKRVGVDKAVLLEEDPQLRLRGELDRRLKVGRLLARLSRKGRRLITVAIESEGQSLRVMARRSKMGKRRAAKVLASFVRAIGPDPSVEHLRRVISRP